MALIWFYASNTTPKSSCSMEHWKSSSFPYLIFHIFRFVATSNIRQSLLNWRGGHWNRHWELKRSREKLPMLSQPCGRMAKLFLRVWTSIFRDNLSFTNPIFNFSICRSLIQNCLLQDRVVCNVKKICSKNKTDYCGEYSWFHILHY